MPSHRVRAPDRRTEIGRHLCPAATLPGGDALGSLMHSIALEHPLRAGPDVSMEPVAAALESRAYGAQQHR